MPATLTLEAAAAHLARGELVAFPTETVYGLGTNAEDDQAVGKIFAAKGRPADHPLIVHVADLGQVTHFAADVPDFALKLLAVHTPGPLTVILPRRAGVATASAGAQGSIGVRIPAHPVAQALLQASLALGVRGVSAPSANKFGRVSPTTAAHVLAEFGGAVPVLDGGACAVGIESTIVDCTRGEPVLLRPGVLSVAALEVTMGLSMRPEAELQLAAPRASGTLASHYAPSAKVRLLDALPSVPPAGIAVFELPQDPLQAAHDLFATLRDLDAANPHEIWVREPPLGAAWDGVRDRLQRAAA